MLASQKGRGTRYVLLEVDGSSSGEEVELSLSRVCVHAICKLLEVATSSTHGREQEARASAGIVCTLAVERV